MKVLIHTDVHPVAIEELSKDFEVETFSTQEELLKKIENADALLIRSSIRLLKMFSIKART